MYLKTTHWYTIYLCLMHSLNLKQHRSNASTHVIQTHTKLFNLHKWMNRCLIYLLIFVCQGCYNNCLILGVILVCGTCITKKIMWDARYQVNNKFKKILCYIWQHNYISSFCFYVGICIMQCFLFFLLFSIEWCRL